MKTNRFDTLDYVKKARKAGFSEEQAEFLTQSFHEELISLYDYIGDTMYFSVRIAVLECEINHIKMRLK